MNRSLIEFGLVAFSSLFAMVNPLSAAPLFVSMTSGAGIDRRRVAIRASLTAGVAMVIFALAGGAVFAFFGITVPAFQIAGGLLFTISSIRTLQGMAKPEAESTGDDPSIVPIGVPTLAGAGTLSTVMVLAGQARAQWQTAVLGVVILIISLTCLICLLLAPLLVSRLGRVGADAMNRVMGLLTAVIGVQFIINGTTTVLREILLQLPR
jgi:multiple antibiotic resistance protein